MRKYNVSTKKTKYPESNKGKKLPSGAKVHEHDVDHNKLHGTPHIHLEDGTVLNVFTAKIYRGKRFIKKMPSKKLNEIRLAIMDNMIHVAEGKFNLDGNQVLVHADNKDPFPTQLHIHSNNLTFSGNKKVYDVGTQNKKLQQFHQKLNLSNEVVDNYYKKHLTDKKIKTGLLNKLNILAKLTNIVRDYFLKEMHVDFESHDLDAFDYK